MFNPLALRIIAFIIAFSAAVSTLAHGSAPHASLPAGIESGDLVFRDGDEVISQLIETIDHSGYSHVGMIWLTENGVRVIHATPSEHAHSGDQVTIDSLQFFRQHAKNGRVDFYHIKANAEQHAHALRYALQQAGKPFGFTRNKTYCTQLVTEAWQQADVSIISGKAHHVPLLPAPIILPSNIINSARVLPAPASTKNLANTAPKPNP